jgi:hypothetical protein
LSLSQLNCWLPRGQTHPKVMQGTAPFYHQITNSLIPEAAPVFDETTALQTAVGVSLQ